MMMINDNDDDNGANNNVAENAPWNFDDESASSDEDYDYNINRHRPVNNNNSNIVGIPEDEIQQNQQAREIFLRSMSPLVSDGSDLSVGHYTSRIVISGVGWLKSLAQRSFDALSQNAQNLVGNLNPGQACVVYLSSDIVALYHATGHVHFTEDNVAELTRQDIKICGAFPILKTLTKDFGDNSLRNKIGGGKTMFSNLNMTTPTLLRNGVFVAFLHDENFDPWDEIVIDHDSENKLVAAIEEAQNRLSQACVVYLSSDIVACYHATGHVHFTEDNVAELTRQDIKICGAFPILKTLTKQYGDNSLKNKIGGQTFTHINSTTTPALLRWGVFVAFLHDENFDPWDEIEIDHDSENKLVAAIEESRNRRALETFSIYSAEDPRVLLKIVKGVRGIKESVGSVRVSSTGHTLPETTAAIRAEIEEAGGGLYHRNISDTEKAFYICITPKDSTESPVANAETRFSELKNRVSAYSSQNNGGIAQDFHWLIYRAMENNQSEMGPLLGHGKGVNTLKRKLSDLTMISASTFQGHWKKSPTGSKLGSLSKEMWNDQRNSDGTLYNSKANMWVKVVTSEQERLDLV